MFYCLGEIASRLALLVERKTLNLVVVGSSPTVGVPKLLWRSWQRVGLIILRSRVRSSPGAFAFCFFVVHNLFLGRVQDFVAFAQLSVGWPSGPRR